MRYFEIYNPEKTYMFPTSKLATPEVVAESYPALLTFTHIIETDAAGQVLMSLYNLESVRGEYDLSPQMSEAEVLQAFADIMNTPVIEENEPSPEERIAAAMEFQNLLNM